VTDPKPQQPAVTDDDDEDGGQDAAVVEDKTWPPKGLQHK
jgi:hypothetical protein